MNMHRIWEFDVKDHVVQGSNAIEVQIHSPMQAAREAASKYPLWGVTHTTVDGYQHIRKATICMAGIGVRSCRIWESFGMFS